MSSVVISGDTSGAITLAAPAVAGTNTITLPASTGTVLTTGSPQSGGVIQVVSTSLTTSFTASVSSSYTAVTGLTASITPKFSTSQILILITVTLGSDTNYWNSYITKGGTQLSGSVATSNGSRAAGTTSFWPPQGYGTYSAAMQFLDSPATTSSTTYGLNIGNSYGSATVCVNQSQEDSNSSARTRGISTITVMEIAA